jgi:hypothetical protein
LNTERPLLVTARHVVFTLDKNENKHFERKNDGQCRYNITLFGDAAFNKYLESIKAEIGGKALIAQYQERRIRVFEGMDDPAANEERQHAQVELDDTREAMEQLSSFYRTFPLAGLHRRAAFWAMSSSLLPSTSAPAARVILRIGPSSRSTLPRSTRAISKAMPSTSVPATHPTSLLV